MSNHRTVDGKRFACQHCGKAFPTNFLRNKHARVHDEQKKTIPCEKCNRM